MQEYRLGKAIKLPLEVQEILTTLDDTGFFEDGLLVGSWALLFYKEIFGIDYILRTDDIDFAFIPEVLKKKGAVDLEGAFVQKGFDPVRDIFSGLQKFLAGTFEIEFLIHRKGGRDEIVTVGKYNVNALPLPFLDILFISPIDVRMPKFSVRIPSPEALFLHKLIIAQRRKKESKKEKDLEQCRNLAPHLDAGNLSGIVKQYRMSKDTIRKIQKSCLAIDYPVDFLSSSILRR